uniref:snRNA-activating protein complex subunit 4 n=1 Tax=Ursus maritimus TaxID=29073 RepID=A0A452VE56_URSMA
LPRRLSDFMDVDAEREKIAKEIAELERILDPSSSGIGVGVSESGLTLDSDGDSLPEEDSEAAGSPGSEEERWGETSNGEDDPKEKTLPEDPETCLQLNMVYQEVIQERLAEVSLLLAQNREQQEEIMCDLAGSKGPKVKDGKSLPPNLYIGHFMKPYFKDRVTGVGPPANEETREKATQGIKAFEELLVTKWKNWEKALLRRSVVSDRLQRLLQPKLLKLEYLDQKRSKVTSEAERQMLEKQSREAEREVQDIRQLPEEALLGSRLDSHDWEKISNVNFEGGRSAEEIRKFWQNCEHPSINKQEWSGQEVDQLKAIAAKHGHLQWQKIAKELGTNRSAFQCLQKYQQHNKALKRKEWTREEDRLLTQLVQEMRVGSHIPYRRIVYYMEGRDSMQLIYRWTKSLDPGLKKGYWAPEEDAKLLRAVAKYGEQDWFKIREEVPGRSDAQCRDRYLRRLHFSLKKGRWNASEEGKLLELIEKYGVGHWAKIASELPHRTGSQCLSKWKIMVRVRLYQVSPKALSSVGPVSAPGRGRGRDIWFLALASLLPGTPHAVPDMDLWVPARQSTGEPCGGGAQGWPGRRPASPSPPRGSSEAQDGGRAAHPTAPAPTEELGQADTSSRIHSTSARGVGHPDSADTRLSSSEEPADKVGHRPRCTPHCCPGVTRAGAETQQAGLSSRLLERQLLMAMSPWVGDIVLPCTPRRPAAVHTRADAIRKQLKDARLASTPVFTLFIQLFQIDTAGCMEVVRERKAQTPALLQTGTRDPPPGLLQVRSRSFQNLPVREAANQSSGHRGSRGLQPCHSESRPQAPPPAPCGPRPKPKTVSELLREKRLREARARKAAPGTVALPPQLLLSSPLILQPHLPQASPTPSASGPAATATALSGPGIPAATGLSTSAKDERPSTLPVLARALTSTEAPAASTALVPSQVLVSGHQGGLGQSQAPAASRKQGLPEAPLFLPAAPSPVQLPVQPLSLTPALGMHKGGAHVVASTPLPVTWVLTAQGLLPVPAVVGLPGQPPLQADTDPGSGPGGTPGSPGSGGLTGPLSLERPPPPRPGPERCALDLDLLSQESEAAVREWLRGQQGVCVPPLGSRLPYQPPALCSLRALSGLLLHKKALEQRATSLVPCGAAGALQALLGQVQRQLQDSPAYLLLKARFLAAFTLPALLATLSPHGVPTTLSVTTRADPESEDDLEEVELVGDCSTSGLQFLLSHSAWVLFQGAPDPGQGSASSCLDGSDSLDVLRTRHACHTRKRRRLV